MKTIKNQFSRLVLSLLIFLLYICSENAQGDGPRTSLLAPTGVFGIATKYVNLSQNLMIGVRTDSKINVKKKD